MHTLHFIRSPKTSVIGGEKWKTIVSQIRFMFCGVMKIFYALHAFPCYSPAVLDLSNQIWQFFIFFQSKKRLPNIHLFLCRIKKAVLSTQRTKIIYELNLKSELSRSAAWRCIRDRCLWVCNGREQRKNCFHKWQSELLTILSADIWAIWHILKDWIYS